MKSLFVAEIRVTEIRQASETGMSEIRDRAKAAPAKSRNF
jgi:hypothetical protein